MLGAGIGALVRNTGSAVTGAVLALIIAPPLVVQSAGDVASRVPNTLADVLSGVDHDVSRTAAAATLAVWAAVPAHPGMLAVQRCDVV